MTDKDEKQITVNGNPVGEFLEKEQDQEIKTQQQREVMERSRKKAIPTVSRIKRHRGKDTGFAMRLLEGTDYMVPVWKSPIADKVSLILLKNPDREFTTSEILNSFPDLPPSTTRTILTRLCERGVGVRRWNVGKHSFAYKFVYSDRVIADKAAEALSQNRQRVEDKKQMKREVPYYLLRSAENKWVPWSKLLTEEGITAAQERVGFRAKLLTATGVSWATVIEPTKYAIYYSPSGDKVKITDEEAEEIRAYYRGTMSKGQLKGSEKEQPEQEHPTTDTAPPRKARKVKYPEVPVAGNPISHRITICVTHPDKPNMPTVNMAIDVFDNGEVVVSPCE